MFVVIEDMRFPSRPRSRTQISNIIFRNISCEFLCCNRCHLRLFWCTHPSRTLSSGYLLKTILFLGITICRRRRFPPTRCLHNIYSLNCSINGFLTYFGFMILQQFLLFSFQLHYGRIIRLHPWAKQSLTIWTKSLGSVLMLLEQCLKIAVV